MAINPGMIWRVRPSGNNSNGGGFDPTVTSPGTDRSQQDAAFETFNGTTTVLANASASTTVVVTGYSTTANDVGNVVHVTGGTNFLPGWYTIVSVVSGVTGVGTWTFDRACTSAAGAAGAGSMGGGWADFWTNTIGAPLVAGNTVYILGSGIPNPASYTFDYSPSTYFTPVSGSSTAGNVTFANDPSTPNYSTGGMPCIKASGLEFFAGSYIKIVNLWFYVNGSSNLSIGVIYANSNPYIVQNCVFDMNGYKGTAIYYGDAIGNECFSYVATNRGDTSYPAITTDTFVQLVIGNNIHDLTSTSPVISLESGSQCTGNIVAKCAGTAIKVSSSFGINMRLLVSNNTLDGNLGNGIEFGAQQDLALTLCFNNIISNHTGAGKYGMTVDAGTTAANNAVKGFADYNVFYNNTTDLNAIGYGAHDASNSGTAPKLISSTPYVASSTENYTLA